MAHPILKIKDVTFPKPLIFEFEGNIFKNALCLGDVDNDGLSELIVGNDKGDLAIFKGENPKAIRCASELGLISCVIVGDLVNLGRNVLLVIASDGSSYIYDFHAKPLLRESDEKLEMKPAHFQKLPANIKMGLIGDINSDGLCEMVVALTDRIVRTYKWVATGAGGGSFPEGKLVGQNKWELSDQIGGIALSRADDSQTLLVSQPGGTCFTLKPPDDAEGATFDENVSKLLTKMSIEYEALDSASCSNPKIMTEICGDIELDDEEESSFDQFKAASAGLSANNSYFESEMQSVDSGTGYVLTTADGMVMLVGERKILWKTALKRPIMSVSQLLIPNRNKLISSHAKVPRESDEDGVTDESTSESDVDDMRRAGSRRNELSSAAKVLASVNSAPPTPSKASIRIPNSKAKRIPNSKTFGHEMETKIIAFSPDGSTFILNVPDGRYYQFNFHDSANCALSGFYGVRKKDSACLAFAAYSNEIFVYCDVSSTLEYKPSVMEVLRQKPEYLDAVKALGIDINDREKIRQLNSWLLYGYKFPSVPFNPAKSSK